MNAGASRTISRIHIKINNNTPFYFKADVKVVRIRLLKEEIFILPDIILVKKKRNFYIVDYKNVTVHSSTVRFIEEGIVPRVAEVVDYTWKYVNKMVAQIKGLNTIDNYQFAYMVSVNLYHTMD